MRKTGQVYCALFDLFRVIWEASDHSVPRWRLGYVYGCAYGNGMPG